MWQKFISFRGFFIFVGYFNSLEGHNSSRESCEVPQQILTLTFIRSKVTKKPAARQAIYNSALYFSFEDWREFDYWLSVDINCKSYNNSCSTGVQRYNVYNSCSTGVQRYNVYNSCSTGVQRYNVYNYGIMFTCRV